MVSTDKYAVEFAKQALDTIYNFKELRQLYKAHEKAYLIAKMIFPD